VAALAAGPRPPERVKQGLPGAHAGPRGWAGRARTAVQPAEGPTYSAGSRRARGASSSSLLSSLAATVRARRRRHFKHAKIESAETQSWLIRQGGDDICPSSLATAGQLLRHTFIMMSLY